MIAGYTARRERYKEQQYLRDSIKLLRQFVGGFEAENGFDLRYLDKIPEERIARVRKYGPILRRETASPFIKVVPKTKATRRAAQRHTGQLDIPKRKAFAVHVPKNVQDKSRIKFKGKKKKTLEIQTKVRNTVFTQRFFYLSEFGPKPQSFDDVIKTTEKMLPHMPNGFYVIETSTHGSIGAPMARSLLLSRLADRWAVYDVIKPTGQDERGLVETVIGFRLVSTRVDGAMREYQTRETNRMRLDKYRQAQRQKARRALSRRIKVRMK